jgi:cyanophycinase-like exopeptidase
VAYRQAAAALGHINPMHTDMMASMADTVLTKTVRTRLLAIMGSGETSPTMVAIHKALVARLGAGQRGAGQYSAGQYRAILLDTPYAFQENAADISARTQGYFARSVGLAVDVISEASRPAADVAAIRGSDWVFAGPGSPSYALSKWRGTRVPEALRDRIAAGTGITIIASAAAAAMGLLAVPVYEIYKVGADPYWLDGLDLLGVIGLKVVVIPHYDNAEGGTHDTRFCYMGERRLSMIENQIPADSAVLGVDEHTALVFDLDARQVEVLGKGGVTVRKAGVSTVLPSGSTMALPDLIALVKTGVPGAPLAPASTAGRQSAATAPDSVVTGELPELTVAAERQFQAAERQRDSAGMVTATLDLEAAIVAWASDTDENDNSDRARAVLRGLVVRLGKIADAGLADPADRLRPLVEPLLKVRESLRKDGSYTTADEIRAALGAGGVELHDTPDGTDWTITT